MEEWTKLIISNKLQSLQCLDSFHRTPLIELTWRQAVSRYISLYCTLGYRFATSAQQLRNSPSDRLMMFDLCTAVTAFLPVELAYSNANSATLIEACFVISLMLWTTPSTTWNEQKKNFNTDSYMHRTAVATYYTLVDKGRVVRIIYVQVWAILCHFGLSVHHFWPVNPKSSSYMWRREDEICYYFTSCSIPLYSPSVFSLIVTRFTSS